MAVAATTSNEAAAASSAAAFSASTGALPLPMFCSVAMVASAKIDCCASILRDQLGQRIRNPGCAPSHQNRLQGAFDLGDAGKLSLHKAEHAQRR